MLWGQGRNFSLKVGECQFRRGERDAVGHRNEKCFIIILQTGAFDMCSNKLVTDDVDELSGGVRGQAETV